MRKKRSTFRRRQNSPSNVAHIAQRKLYQEADSGKEWLVLRAKRLLRRK